MKNLFLAAVFAVAGISSLNLAQAQPLPRPVAAVIVDLSKEVPKEINLTVGQNLVIQNGFATVSVKATDGKGDDLLETRPRNTFNQVGAYTAKREGAGELTITYSVQTPGHKPMRPATVKVNVKKLVPVPVAVPMGKLPAKVTLEKGQQLNFNIKGTEEAVFQFRTTSKLLTERPAATTKGTVKSYEAVDVGTAEIEVQITTDVPGAKPRTHKITVEIIEP